jgi:hypothetical protein
VTTSEVSSEYPRKYSHIPRVCPRGYPRLLSSGSPFDYSHSHAWALPRALPGALSGPLFAPLGSPLTRRLGFYLGFHLGFAPGPLAYPGHGLTGPVV